MAFKGPSTSTFAGVHPPARFWPYAAALISIRLATLVFLAGIVIGSLRFIRGAGSGWVVAVVVSYHILIHAPLDAIPRYFLPTLGLAGLLAVVGVWPGVRRLMAMLRQSC